MYLRRVDYLGLVNNMSKDEKLEREISEAVQALIQCQTSINEKHLRELINKRSLKQIVKMETERGLGKCTSTDTI